MPCFLSNRLLRNTTGMVKQSQECRNCCVTAQVERVCATVNPVCYYMHAVIKVWKQHLHGIIAS
jgi:hypothetical protein